MIKAPKNPRARDRLRALEVSPHKSRGQNFIINPFVVETILNFGAPSSHEQLVEIGPGLGALTTALYETAERGNKPLILIEIEAALCAELERRFPHARIIHADIRKVDMSSLGSGLTVFGNLPYSFSSEIIFHMLSHRKSIARAVFMLQREFAERVAASPGTKDYSSLTVATQLHADTTLGPCIPGDAFHPPTKVESMLLQLDLLPQPRVTLEDPEFFERVVRAAFGKRRRTLENSLESTGFFNISQIQAACAQAAIDPKCRAETLSIDQFAALARALR